MSDILMINGQIYPRAGIVDISWQNYTLLAQEKMPKRLYKYFPNLIDGITGRNYSKEALINNTVHLQSPIYFDDPYDCTLCLDEQEFHLQRMKYYAELCGFKYDPTWDINKLVYTFSIYLYPHLKDRREWETIFKIKYDENDYVDLVHKSFATTLRIEIFNHINNDNTFQIAFYQALHEEFLQKQKDLVSKFRIACFTTDPFSMRMWSHYADAHRGFCIEYAVPKMEDRDKNISINLFPVIYSDERVSVLEQCLHDLKNPKVTEDDVWPIFKYGLLNKGYFWSDQNEWRLVSLDDMLADQPDYNCSFFPISKVYLGAKMSENERKGIISLCKERNIPTTCVVPAVGAFLMQECGGKETSINCVYRKEGGDCI